ncbi:hypothetical protein NT04LM_0704, partial [Listeria monocytogenes FSL F2-208]
TIFPHIIRIAKGNKKPPAIVANAIPMLIIYTPF